MVSRSVLNFFNDDVVAKYSTNVKFSDLEKIDPLVFLESSCLRAAAGMFVRL